jgi:hypothetical protein
MFLKLIPVLEKSGAEEDRTPGPLLAKQMLSQLSYSPKISCKPYIYAISKAFA